MPELKNLVVEWVSLVDRAAVRDPSEPDQPQRFLLTKSEVPVWKRDSEAPGNGVIDMTELQAGIAKMGEAIEALEARQILKNERASTMNETTSEERLTKALHEVTDLRKREGVDVQTSRKITKASRDVQAEYLAAMSPAGYEAWANRGKGPSSAAVLDVTDRADQLRKADPSMSPYAAKLKAMQEDRTAQAAYLASVR